MFFSFKFNCIAGKLKVFDKYNFRKKNREVNRFEKWVDLDNFNILDQKEPWNMKILSYRWWEKHESKDITEYTVTIILLTYLKNMLTVEQRC